VQEDFRLIVDLVLVLAVAAWCGLLAAMPSTRFTGLPAQWSSCGPAGLGLIKELIQVETLAQFGVAFFYLP